MLMSVGWLRHFNMSPNKFMMRKKGKEIFVWFHRFVNQLKISGTEFMTDSSTESISISWNSFCAVRYTHVELNRNQFGLIELLFCIFKPSFLLFADWNRFIDFCVVNESELCVVNGDFSHNEHCCGKTMNASVIGANKTWVDRLAT